MSINYRPVGGYFSRYSNYGTKTTFSQYYTVNASAVNPAMGSVSVERIVSALDILEAETNSQHLGVKGANSFPAGTKVQIKANPASGCKFVTWNGDFPAGKRQQNPIIVTLTKNIVISANFEQIGGGGGGNNQTVRTATVKWNQAMGRVTGNGLTINSDGTNKAVATLDAYAGTSFTLEAQANQGYVFKRWDMVGLAGNIYNLTSPTLTVAMPDHNITIQAVFEQEGGNGDPNHGGGEDPNPGGGEDPGTGGGNGNGSTLTVAGVDLKAMLKKYWWVLAIVVVWYLYKKGKLW